MVVRNEEVQERIRKELTENPDKGSSELYALAQEMDGEIGSQSVQQFHARYVLPIKREQSRARGGGAAKRTRRKRAAAGSKEGRTAGAGRKAKRDEGGNASAADRDRVRGVFHDFARDFAAAESRSDIVKVLSRVDQYVDRIVGS